MDTPFMESIAKSMADARIQVRRFEFPYMARRRAEGGRRPPDRAPRLLECFEMHIETAKKDCPDSRLAIGGKSMGGRMATMLSGKADAVIAFGYPFHPPGKPDKLRTDHLRDVSTPMLIIQGERDPFGNATEAETFDIAPSIRFKWLADGDHSFKPRKKSGHTEQEHWLTAAQAAVQFLSDIP